MKTIFELLEKKKEKKIYFDEYIDYDGRWQPFYDKEACNLFNSEHVIKISEDYNFFYYICQNKYKFNEVTIARARKRKKVV